MKRYYIYLLVPSISRSPAASLGGPTDFRFQLLPFIIMSLDSFPCQLVSWREAYLLAKGLAKSVKASGFSPDLVVAIGRGGYVPARTVCDFLLHERLTSMKVEHYGLSAQRKDEAMIRYPLAVDVRGDRLLIVDDVTDTGDTLKTAVGYVQSLQPAEVRTGVLQHKTTSSFQPDYFAGIVREWRWIIYPWAAHEDLVGFTDRALSDRLLSPGQIGDQLREKYAMAVDDRTLREVLTDLVEMGWAEKRGNLYKKAAAHGKS
jgi:hypoxanthine phosphoribosyltransferase